MSRFAKRAQRGAAGKGHGSGGNGLNGLARIPWEGGPAYYNQFAKASSQGWNSASFIPISVFMGKPSQAAQIVSLGINTYMAAEHDGSTMGSMTSTGLYVMPQHGEWTPAEVGSDPKAVAWFISDECEMGYSGCDPTGTGTEYDTLAVQQSYVTSVNNLNDGRFKHANFGNGILRTFWAPNTMDDHVALMDTSSADKYTYTSPHVWGITADSPDWPVGATVSTAASYGWQVDQMKRFQNPASLKPIWTFIETAMPYLTEPGALTIQPDQIEGAVWSAIIHEARGIAYFQHNNNGVCGIYSLVECSQALKDKVTAINASVTSLAPIINTQSYVWDCQAVGVDTMLKSYNGFAYIFAGIGIGGTTGSKKLLLPPGITATNVEVVGEARSITATRDTYSKTFQYTGAAQSWTVPAGVTSVTVDMYGAAGRRTSGARAGVLAGLGGRVQATLSVTPGEILQINVGGMPSDLNGGWNGGGSVNPGNCDGAGGGGTDIRQSGTALANRVLVAGGGGGCSDDVNSAGGHGGGLVGANGAGGDGGGGGTQSTGGTAMNDGGPGVLGQGGFGHVNGAGGGGGYYGGGGGGWNHGGGGGGSSYAGAGTSGVTHTQGVRSGNGMIVISTTQINAESLNIVDTYANEYTHHIYKVAL